MGQSLALFERRKRLMGKGMGEVAASRLVRRCSLSQSDVRFWTGWPDLNLAKHR